MQETTMILDRLRVVKIDAHIWGGRKKLHKEDLILAHGSVLPPEDLASLGSKKIADPTELAVFNRLKKEAERVCLKVGTRFLGGFAIPEGSLDSIRSELEQIAVRFREARAEFLARYDQTIDAWIARHPGFEQAIRRAVDPVEVVAAGLRFDYIIFRVSHPESTETGGAAESSLDRKVGSLSETLFREIAQDANDLVESSLLGRQAVTRKALSPFKRIRDKLNGLAFLDHRVHPVVATLDDLLARIPKTGALDGSYLSEMIATALLLSDPDKIKRHGEGLTQIPELSLPMNHGSAPASVPGDDSPAESVSPVIDHFALFDDLAEEPEPGASSVGSEPLGSVPEPSAVTTVADDCWF